MPRNILITGAAGYIGGSILADILSKHPEVTKKQVLAAVRTDEQAKALSIHGINVLKLDLSDEHAVVNEIFTHKISVIVHAANSIDPGLTLHLINGLAKQKEATGKPTYFIHTSGLSAFYANSGWPCTINTDTDAVFETEKKFADSYPVRKSLQAVHISDLTALYCRIIHAALNKEEIPSGKEGYYFAVAHDLDMWEFQDHLAATMKARGLVTSDKSVVYPSDEFAAEAIDVPVEFLSILYKSGGHFTATRPQSIGWKPKWNKERFLKNVDADIGDVVELGKAKSSLVDSLFAAVGRAR
ncbi:hypothetical protein FANTH_10356 [Fusarium anthophilum]|uniref:NAD-dependent epimerase/dehydratase domain-containing protein n=1 Tax=Fusarium anthophilum TaxID=48485 RepID=A0A8H5DWG1_9HYPO|nr:hypothetical protein FANTH_10356 [Fusarium anthophilum]